MARRGEQRRRRCTSTCIAAASPECEFTHFTPSGANPKGDRWARVGIGIGHPKVGNLWSHRPPSRGLPPAEALHLFSNNEAAASAPPVSSRPQTAVVGASHSRPFSRRSRQRPWSGPSGLSEEERNRLHRSRPPSRGRPPPETLQL